MYQISKETCALIRQALREDIGSGDITTDALVPSHLKGTAYIQAKSNGILSGGSVVKEVFRSLDPRLKVTQKISDGSRVSKGKKVFILKGRLASILKGERVALNFLAHLSGIATLTYQFAAKVKGTRAKIYDTRKTTPLWRELEKYAVRAGGGANHRFGLWDEILVKDNHWSVLTSLRGVPEGTTKQSLAVRLLRQRLKYCLAMTKRKKVPVEIEVANFRKLSHLLEGEFRPDRILLDNFSVRDLKRAVKFVKKIRRGISLEASGGITLANVRSVAKTGADRISVGALTHSSPALDFSLEVV